MNKKALSGLVVAVLLLAICLTIGGLIMGWMSKSTTASIDSSTEKDLIRFNCLNLKFKVVSATITEQGTSSNKEANILIENSGENVIKGFFFKFVTTNDESFAFEAKTSSDNLNPYSRKTYTLDSSSVDTGGSDTPLATSRTSPTEAAYTIFSIEIVPIIDVTVDTPVESKCSMKFRIVDTEEGSLTEYVPTYAFTMVDPGGTWINLPNGVDTNEGDQGDCSYSYRQLSSPATGDYTLRFKFHVTTNTIPNTVAFFVGLSNSTSCWDYSKNDILANMNYMIYAFNRVLQLQITHEGVQHGYPDNTAIAASTDYYIELDRSGLILTATVYTDEDFTVLLDTVQQNPIDELDTMNYLLIGMNRGDNPGPVIDFTVEEISFTSS